MYLSDAEHGEIMKFHKHHSPDIRWAQLAWQNSRLRCATMEGFPFGRAAGASFSLCSHRCAKVSTKKMEATVQEPTIAMATGPFRDW